MTIDEAINHLGNYSSTNGSGLTTDKQHNEAKRVAIDTFRKYKKIKEIVDKWKGDSFTDGFSWDCIKEIADIVDEVEDGKID